VNVCSQRRAIIANGNGEITSRVPKTCPPSGHWYHAGKLYCEQQPAAVLVTEKIIICMSSSSNSVFIFNDVDLFLQQWHVQQLSSMYAKNVQMVQEIQS
jgi:hypothetical protein